MIQIGDTVAIRGELRLNNNGQCAYTPDQLINGHLKNSVTGRLWLGQVLKISNDLALVGGGWWHIRLLTKQEAKS